MCGRERCVQVRTEERAALAAARPRQRAVHQLLSEYDARPGLRLDPVHFAVHFVIFVGEPRVMRIVLLEPRNQFAIPGEDLSQFIGRVLRHAGPFRNVGDNPSRGGRTIIELDQI